MYSIVSPRASKLEEKKLDNFHVLAFIMIAEKNIIDGNLLKIF
jgi:hypothetical protein